MSYQAPRNGFRTFVIVWATQSVSVLGSQLTFFATTIWLTQVLYPRPEQKQALAFALSANGLGWALPAVFGAPLAGARADRHDRKRTMMVMDFANSPARGRQRLPGSDGRTCCRRSCIMRVGGQNGYR